MKRISLIAAILSIFVSSNAIAQSYNSYEGRLFIVDNPTSAPCQSANINFGNVYTMIYRQTFDTANYSDGLSIGSDRYHFLITSTQLPSRSLNRYVVGGPSSTSNGMINSRAFGSSGVVGSTNLAIDRAFNGGGTPIASTQNIVISGTIDNFNQNSGCNVTVKGTGAKRPD